MASPALSFTNKETGQEAISLIDLEQKNTTSSKVYFLSMNKHIINIFLWGFPTLLALY